MRRNLADLGRFALLFVFNLFLLIPVVGLAATEASTTLQQGLAQTGKTAGFGENAQSIESLIGGIISVVLGFLGILLLVYMIWGGWIYASAQGEKEKIEKAKKMISNAVIGAILIVAAYAIASYVIAAITTATSTT